MNGSLPGSSVHGISQARIQKWVAISFCRDLPYPGIEPGYAALASGFFTTEPPGEAHYHLLLISMVPTPHPELVNVLRTK